MASISHSAAALTSSSASDLFRSSSNGVSGLSLKTLGRASFAAPMRGLTVTAKLRKGKKHERPWPEDPDPNVKGGVLFHLSHFKPSKDKPKTVMLEFEKPLLDLEKKIVDVRKMADQTGLDFSDQITSLEEKYQQALKDLYTHLTPIQRVNIARHPNRPTFLDHVFNITDTFVELHGDRCGYDDPAIVTGIGNIDGQRFMFIGHQKGRNTKENIKRNFGMPTPHGYRKALRMMYYADHHGFPIVTFIDTPGAYADLKSEELGQGEAIAHNLRSMFGLKVPVISIVIGEGGSGGALAIGCANKLLMLENAVFYVASPEACAAILWKTAKASPKAAKKLKITARRLYKLKIADGVIREPLGGAHTDPEWTSQKIKAAINNAMKELTKMDTEKLLKHRMQKFRKIGGFQEGIQIEASKKVNMKKREESELQRISNKELEGEVEMLKKQVLKAMESSREPPELALRGLIGKLKKEVDREYDEAYKALGLKDRLDSVRAELSKINANKQPVTPELVDMIKNLEDEFNQNLQEAPNCTKLQFKLRMLNELIRAKSLSDAATLKVEVNKKFKEVLEQPGIMEKVQALKAEIQNSGASNFVELNQELKEKVGKVKKEVEGEVVNVLQSMGFDVEAIKSNMKVLSEQGPFSGFRDKMDTLNEELEKKIGDITKSSELKDLIQLLKLETAKAGKAPDAVAKSKVEVLENHIKQRVSESLRSSELKREHEKLIGEISTTINSSGASDGSLKGSKSEEPRVEVNLAA